MAMVESRIIAPVIIRRMDNNPGIERLRAAEKAAPVKPLKVPDNEVSISGKGLLLQRLGTKDSAAVKESGSKRPIDHLTSVDRHLIGDVYEYARGKGADLKNVDDLAKYLARYRQQLAAPDTAAKNTDKPGSFSEQESATVKRILGSNAMTTTRLDQGFIHYMTDKDSPRSPGNLEFMEQVIQQFSVKAKS